MTRRDHLDHRLPPEVRAELLAREMTVVEKSYQLTAVEVYLGLDAHDRQLESAFELTGAPRPLGSAERSFFSEVEVADV